MGKGVMQATLHFSQSGTFPLPRLASSSRKKWRKKAKEMEPFPRACRQDAFAHNHVSTLSWHFHGLVRTWLLASANWVGANHPVLPLIQ